MIEFFVKLFDSFTSNAFLSCDSFRFLFVCEDCSLFNLLNWAFILSYSDKALSLSDKFFYHYLEI